MNRIRIFMSCCLVAVGVLAHAETARKAPAARGVDLEAAARATAALYASPLVKPESAAPSPAPTPIPAPAAAAVLQKVPPVPLPAAPLRSSPLLPATAVWPAVAAPLALEPATPQAAADVWSGAYHCEHAQKVSLRPGASTDQVELQWKAQRWQMRRVDSRSGALRLEDAGARMVWIQLGNKSMLLDQRLGKRLLDECQHDVQVETAARMRNNPPPALFDTSGMGR